MAKHGGVLPLNTKLVKSSPRGGEGEAWYLVARNPVITGNQLRNARSGQDDVRKWETSFTLSQDGGKRFGRYTEANIGNRLAVVLDNQTISVATIQSKIEDQGRITIWAASRKPRTWRSSCGPVRCRRASFIARSVRSDLRSAPIRSAKAWSRARPD